MKLKQEKVMENARNIGKARVVVTDHGEIHAFVTADVMYDLESCQEVIRNVVGIYHPMCCSGMNIAFKLAIPDAGKTP
jgi:hypothetical protein